MKIVKSPLRISLGGGGTDLPNWYKDNGGFLITAAINKYIYFFGCERPFDKKFWLSYSKTEVCESVSEIKHELLAKCLERFTLPNGFEIHSISEVPGNSGLGSSGSFLVGALTLLNATKKIEVSRQELAEVACRIEMVELQKNSGKQDQYAAAMGGIMTLELDRSGNVKYAPLEMNPMHLKHLQNNLLIFGTGISRKAEDVLKDQSSGLKDRQKTIDAMARIQQIGYESRDCLRSGELDRFGRLMHEHWEVKKAMSDMMTSSELDRMYDFAMEAGALGGKVMGAGGGGYYLFYVPPSKQLGFRQKMAAANLIEMDWQFEFAGCSVCYSQ